MLFPSKLQQKDCGDVSGFLSNSNLCEKSHQTHKIDLCSVVGPGSALRTSDRDKKTLAITSLLNLEKNQIMSDEAELNDSEGNTIQQQEQPQLLSCAFNQDGGCLALGTTEGFSLLNLHPFQTSVHRRLNGGIGSIEMLFRCNLIALVGGGAVNPYAPSHRVLIWDDHVQKAIGELSFRQVVLSVKLRRDAIAVALRDRVYVYHLADLSLRDKIYTADNPHGLLCLSTAIPDMVLACPSVTDGHVRVERYGVRKVVVSANTGTVCWIDCVVNLFFFFYYSVCLHGCMCVCVYACACLVDGSTRIVVAGVGTDGRRHKVGDCIQQGDRDSCLGCGNGCLSG